MRNSKNKLLIIIISMLVLLLVAGFTLIALIIHNDNFLFSKSKHPLVGKWKLKESELARLPQGTQIEVEFTDEKYIVKMKSPVSLFNDKEINYHMSMNYTINSVKNNVYNITVSGASVDILNSDTVDFDKIAMQRELLDLVSATFQLNATFDLILSMDKNEFKEQRFDGLDGIYYVRYQ